MLRRPGLMCSGTAPGHIGVGGVSAAKGPLHHCFDHDSRSETTTACAKEIGSSKAVLHLYTIHTHVDYAHAHVGQIMHSAMLWLGLGAFAMSIASA